MTQPSNEPVEPLPEWAEAWDKRTAELAYEACRGTRETLSVWADTLDTKLVAVLGAGSVLLTLIPSLQPPGRGPVTLVCWSLALVCWVWAAGFGWYGYRPAALRVGPSPRTFLGEDWLRLPPYQFHLYQIEIIADTYEHNLVAVKRKAEALGWALAFTVAEVLFLSAALFLQ